MNKKTNKEKKIKAIVDGIEKGTNKYSAKEKNMPRDVARIDKNIGGMNRGPLAEIWNNVMDLWKAVQDPDVPIAPKLVIIGALIYVISPIDLAPDFIPGVGLLDDVAVIMLIFGLMSDLINKVKGKTLEVADEGKNMAVEVMEEGKDKIIEVMDEGKNKIIEIAIIVSVVVAILVIIVALTIRLINTV